MTETNRYAGAIIGQTARARPWQDVGIVEMKAFEGIMILMGILNFHD